MSHTKPVVLPLALLVLAGCAQPPAEGTSVGNPGMFALVAAPGLDGITITSAVLPQALARVHSCDEEDSFEEVELGDFTQGSESTLPAGRWCRLEVETSAGAEFVLEDDEDQFELFLPIDTIDLRSENGSLFEVDKETAHILELASPGWANEDHLVKDEDDLPDSEVLELATRVEEDSALFVDIDSDGELDTQERESGAVAMVLAEPAEDPDGNVIQQPGDSEAPSGCAESSCAASGDMSLGLLVGLGIPSFARRRRRATRS